MDQLEKKDFKPKPIHYRFAKLYMKIPRMTHKAMASELKLHRNTIANWVRDDRLMEWVRAQCQDMLEESRIELYRVGLQKAMKGKFEFWKVCMEMLGAYRPGMTIENKGDMEKVIIEIVQSQAQAQTQPQELSGGSQEAIEGSVVDE